MNMATKEITEFYESAKKYCDFVSKLNDDFSEFNSIIILAFDGDMNQRFETSIRVAQNVGASEDKLLRNSAERDAFFSEE